MHLDTKFVEQSKALAGEPRLQILQWLREPGLHFGHQQTGDPAAIGVCVSLIAEKLAVSQPTASRHLELLKNAGFLDLRKIGKWSFYARNEAQLRAYKSWLESQI